jgi:hypothetical protein
MMERLEEHLTPNRGGVTLIYKANAMAGYMQYRAGANILNIALPNIHFPNTWQVLIILNIVLPNVHIYQEVPF